MAKRRFTPEERGCYFKEELPLKYLPSDMYRYEMSNCLFEAAYEEVDIFFKNIIKIVVLLDFKTMQLHSKLPCSWLQRKTCLLSWSTIDLHE